MGNRQLKNKLAQNIRSLQHKSGLCSASNLDSTNGYDKAWIRDNIYEALGLEQVKDTQAIKSIFSGLFDLFIKHEGKIDRVLKGKNLTKHDYLHPRYCPITLNELPGDWANKQHDSIGSFLFKVGDLQSKDIHVIRNEQDLRIVQKLVYYLEKIEYWNNPDSGMWEQEETLRASSIGACLAGLISVSNLVVVPEQILINGRKALDNLLPSETENRIVDLSLLSLIYPFNVVNDEQRDSILKNIETKLVREQGVIRFYGDRYFNNGCEAEWFFGFPWLAKIYKDLGERKKYAYYVKKTLSVVDPQGHVPELFLGGTQKCNTNTPLGWSMALTLCAI